MKTYLRNNQSGFSLLEFIVALVVAAIMASMIYTYFGNALTQSSVPIFRLQKASNLQKVMENIIADYERLNKLNLRFKWRANANYNIGDIVLPSDNIVTKDSKIANNGRYYKCTAVGTGISGSSLPTWDTDTATNTALGNTLTDGGVTWTEQGYVWKESTPYPANAIVIPAINNGHFYRGPGADFTTTATEPTWPTGADSQVTETSGPQWTEIGTILESAVLTENLSTFLLTPARYGTGYTLVTADTKFIQFNGTTEVNAGASGTSSEKNLLKITIKNSDSAETLTQIFTIR
jgi:prepilin-type N-terminal cleavage/methylation domain-containing protein